MIKGFGAVTGVLMLTFLQACEAPGPPLVVARMADDIVARVPPATAPTPPAISSNPPAPSEEPLFSERDRDPRRLLRMGHRGVSTLLGKPQFVRREAGARVWQYRTETCVLDLFLYDVASNYEVVHYEFRPVGDLSGPTRGCFEKFLIRAATVANS